MKKIIVVLLISLLVLTGCKKTEKLSSEVLKAREDIVSSLGKTNDKQIIINFKNNAKENCYYLFTVTDTSYIQYLYTFHDSQSSYDNYLEKYQDSYYELAKYNDALVTKITLQKASQKGSENMYNTIIDKYQDKKYNLIK